MGRQMTLQELIEAMELERTGEPEPMTQEDIDNLKTGKDEINND